MVQNAEPNTSAMDGTESEPDMAPLLASRFLFVDVAAQRAKQLRRGALPRIERTHAAAPHKLERVAMEEVRTGMIHYTLPVLGEVAPRGERS